MVGYRTGDDDNCGAQSPLDQVEGIAYGLVPSNIVEAAAANNLLGIITFFVVLGVLVRHRPDAPSVIYTFMEELNRMLAGCIAALIMFTPVGVFCLLFPTIAVIENLGSLMHSVGLLIGCLIAGLAVQVGVVYPSLYPAAERTSLSLSRPSPPPRNSHDAAAAPPRPACRLHGIATSRPRRRRDSPPRKTSAE